MRKEKGKFWRWLIGVLAAIAGYIILVQDRTFLKDLAWRGVKRAHPDPGRVAEEQLEREYKELKKKLEKADVEMVKQAFKERFNAY
jgi:hypothetical protein